MWLISQVLMKSRVGVVMTTLSCLEEWTQTLNKNRLINSQMEEWIRPTKEWIQNTCKKWLIRKKKILLMNPLLRCAGVRE